MIVTEIKVKHKCILEITSYNKKIISKPRKIKRKFPELRGVFTMFV